MSATYCQPPINAPVGIFSVLKPAGGNPLSLPLFVLGVRADDSNDALSADNLAIFADPPDAASDFHGSIPRSSDSKRTGESIFIARIIGGLKSRRKRLQRPVFVPASQNVDPIAG